MSIYNEKYERPTHWEVIDTIKYVDGHTEVRNYFNTVVNNCSVLIACLISGITSHKGISYWAIGSGESTWNNENLPSPDPRNGRLIKETYRKKIKPQDICFVNSDNKPVNTITNKIQVSVTFSENEANGELREFALFGGDATSEPNSGIMINHKIHSLIYKTDGMVLNRIIRLSF